MSTNQKIFRRQWRACLADGKTEILSQEKAGCRTRIGQLIDEGMLLGASIYRWKNNLFLYCETIDCELVPGELLSPIEGALALWPGSEEPRRWIEMMDVFHFNEPVSLEHWRRKSPVEQRIGKVGLLRPEMVSSYIYYHYGLQEERSFGGDKYEIIALHENLLFGYFELPAVVEAPLTEPKLKTRSMPENWLDAKISSHFIRWPDMPNSLRPIDEWLSVWQN